MGRDRTSASRLTSIRQRAKAMQMRVDGYALEEIALALGMTEVGVRKHLEAAYAAHQARINENVERERMLASRRIEFLWHEAVRILKARGRKNPVVQLMAIDKLTKIAARHARFYGLDAVDSTWGHEEALAFAMRMFDIVAMHIHDPNVLAAIADSFKAEMGAVPALPALDVTPPSP
jgi:hypothetical protein